MSGFILIVGLLLLYASATGKLSAVIKAIAK